MKSYLRLLLYPNMKKVEDHQVSQSAIYLCISIHVSVHGNHCRAEIRIERAEGRAIEN